MKFNYTDVYEKYGENFKCELTGRPLKWREPGAYEYDHIVPVSKGGSNEFENLQIVCREANRAKGDLMQDDFIRLCHQVIEHAKTKGTNDITTQKQF